MAAGAVFRLVIDQLVTTSEMADLHRVLVDGQDRLGSLGQLEALEAAGWRGPVSFEAFAPEVHASADPVGELRRSMGFIRERLARRAA